MSALVVGDLARARHAHCRHCIDDIDVSLWDVPYTLHDVQSRGGALREICGPPRPAVATFVWMRNKEGGQEIGNVEEIRHFDRDTYARCCARFHGNPHYTYESLAYDTIYALVISHDNGETWDVFRLSRSLKDCLPARYKFRRGWVRYVADFRSPEAHAHLGVADSDRRLRVADSGNASRQAVLDL